MTNKKEDVSGPTPVRFTRELEVELSDKEKIERMSDLITAMNHTDALVTQKSMQTADLNAEIKTSKKVVRELSAALQSGKEKRDVECIEVHLFATNTVEIRRTDTNVLVEKRAMTADERQMGLPGGIGAGKPPTSGQPLLATVGEHLAEQSNSVQCPFVLDGKQCHKPALHRGSHDYLDEVQEIGSAPEHETPFDDQPEVTDPQTILANDAGPTADEGGPVMAPKRRGRPAGSKNKPKVATEPTPGE